jgi:hypothetical protein
MKRKREWAPIFCTEIWILIFEYLDHKDLWYISRVCKFFRCIKNSRYIWSGLFRKLGIQVEPYMVRDYQKIKDIYALFHYKQWLEYQFLGSNLVFMAISDFGCHVNKFFEMWILTCKFECKPSMSSSCELKVVMQTRENATPELPGKSVSVVCADDGRYAGMTRFSQHLSRLIYGKNHKEVVTEWENKGPFYLDKIECISVQRRESQIVFSTALSSVKRQPWTGTRFGSFVRSLGIQWNARKWDFAQ